MLFANIETLQNILLISWKTIEK